MAIVAGLELGRDRSARNSRAIVENGNMTRLGMQA